MGCYRGLYTVEVGDDDAVDDPYDLVPPGFFSPAGYTCLMSCLTGAFCPSYLDNLPFELAPSQYQDYPECAAQLPQFGNATAYCCSNGHPPLMPNATSLEPLFCPGDGELNDPCPPGFYCPTTSSIVECPAGYVCPAGSTTPLECGWLNHCPAGSGRAAYSALGPILVFFALGALVLLGLAVAWAQRHLRNSRITPLAKITVAVMPGPDMVVQIQNNTSSLPLLGPHLKGMGVVFEDLTVTVPNGTTILNGCTGRLRAGRLTAIMGNSGSGKSSLLNVLSHRASYARLRHGRVEVTGLQPGTPVTPRLFGFVPQDDVLHRALTVQEALFFQVRLRVRAGDGPEDTMALVNDVLELMRLTRVQHTVVGGEAGGRAHISGGELRRLSMGMELVAQPGVLMLDEVTSGIDSAASFGVMEALKAAVTLHGLTAAAVIHQPRAEIYEMFDDLILMGDGGQIVYVGQAGQAPINYLARLGYVKAPLCNPADFIVDSLNGPAYWQLGRPNLAHAWRLHEAEQPRSVVPKAPPSAGGPVHVLRAPGLAQQLVVQLRRTLVMLRHRRWEVACDHFLMLMASLLLAALCRQTPMHTLPPRSPCPAWWPGSSGWPSFCARTHERSGCSGARQPRGAAWQPSLQPSCCWTWFWSLR